MAPAGNAAAKAHTGASGAGSLLVFAGKILHSDMDSVWPDGKPTDQMSTFTGAFKADFTVERAAQHQMALTQEEKNILHGKEGEERAKLMKILIIFGNDFCAEKLVKLGGAPHSNMYIGTDHMAAMIEMFDQCAKAGLKSYAPNTVNPRSYDLYNVQNNAKDMTLIYESHKRQRDLDYVHVLLGAPDLN